MIRLKRKQLEVFTNPSRFRMVSAGRRFGKTYLAQTELLRAGNAPGKIAWYVGPTYKQAKRVVWDSLKDMTRPFWRGRPSETDLRIELRNGGIIAVRGADAYDSLRGEGLDFVVLDEFASMAPAAWHNVLRPMLADRQGEALFIGTPQGFNHFYELYTAADEHADWATFHFTTEQGGNVTAEELASAASQMDERLYRQEFQADFEELRSGRVYPDFDRKLDVKDVEYDPNHELCWTLDFNIGFPCSLLCQIVQDHVIVFDEIALADVNTLAVCEHFERKLKPLWELQPGTGRMDVRVFGDATGNSRQSSAGRTNWQIIRDFFTDHPIVRHLHESLTRSNPKVIERLSCVNGRIKNHNGLRRFTVSPRCKSLIRDLEQVCWKTDAHGNKLNEPDDKNLRLTHASDALGYLMHRKFPMLPLPGERSGFIC